MHRLARLAAISCSAATFVSCTGEPAEQQQREVPPAEAPTPPVVREAPPAPRGARANRVIAVDGEGLRLFDPVTGSSLPLSFGLARDAVMAALPYRGEVRTGRLEECGAGPLDFAGWGDGLSLYFQHGRFVGWAADDRSSGDRTAPRVTTAAGIGVGSSRAELETAYAAKVFESSLGTEFGAGDLFGVLEGSGPNEKIAAMWAGATCVMR